MKFHLRSELVNLIHSVWISGVTFGGLGLLVFAFGNLKKTYFEVLLTVWPWPLILLTIAIYPITRWRSVRQRKNDFELVKAALARGSIESDVEYYLLEQVASEATPSAFTAAERTLASVMRSNYEPQL